MHDEHWHPTSGRVVDLEPAQPSWEDFSPEEQGRQMLEDMQPCVWCKALTLGWDVDKNKPLCESGSCRVEYVFAE